MKIFFWELKKFRWAEPRMFYLVDGTLTSRTFTESHLWSSDILGFSMNFRGLTSIFSCRAVYILTKKNAFNSKGNCVKRQSTSQRKENKNGNDFLQTKTYRIVGMKSLKIGFFRVAWNTLKTFQQPAIIVFEEHEKCSASWRNEIECMHMNVSPVCVKTNTTHFLIFRLIFAFLSFVLL